MSAPCPRGVRCESCGAERADLIVVEVATAAGVLCVTVCPVCAAGLAGGGRLPVTVATAGRLVEQHREHLVAAGFLCPRCGRRSSHFEDLREGYCGSCHYWTAEPVAAP